MSPSRTPQEVGRLAAAIYERDIRRVVEAEHAGEYLVINVDTGEYLIGKDWLSVSDQADRSFPKGSRFLMRIGATAAVRIGTSRARSWR